MTKVPINLPSENVTNVLGNVTSPFVVISELVKNGVDAGANAVTINIDTENSQVKIIDDGKGVTKEEIIELGIASESRKKRENNLKSPTGEMFLGSKGLAIFSAFSLGSKVRIKTKNENNGAYIIEWDKGQKDFDYYEIDSHDGSEGTEILISGINFKEMLLLSSERELKKFKHISIRNFKKNINIPRIILLKNSNYIDTDLKNIQDFSDDFTAKESFSYSRKENTLEYRYEIDDPRISKKKVTFQLSDNIDMQKHLKEHYKIKRILVNLDEYLTKNLIGNNEIEIPDFEGVWYMKRDRKNRDMNDFGYEIRLYVNNFALYNYLNTNNDRLQLTNISQNKKNTNYKQHNVFGYLNFPGFNDLEEGLKISNERGGFIENVYFNKFMDVLYTFVLLPTISIDIAPKNKLFINNPEKESGNIKENNGTVNPPEITGGTVNGDKPDKPLSSNPPSKGQKKLVGEIKTKKLLKFYLKVLEIGQPLYLRDPDLLIEEAVKIIPASVVTIENEIFSPKNKVGIYKINYYKDDIKETLTVEVKDRKVIFNSDSDTKFFGHSSCFIGEIDLSDIGELVKQLYDLDYDTHYLLYVISFRAILEDIVKNTTTNVVWD